ncbi:hypothetical protein [Corynebacterium sp. NML 120412]|uniref:hypothetical protein n=1 Tax=Corynebacterium sp. NML 120412 TaxID=2029401 RepID=UPI001303FA96|nr:hypothetical protein [Corynebacterium sp. NML 120412]
MRGRRRHRPPRRFAGLPAWLGERGTRAAVSWAGSIGQLLLVHGLTAPDRQ